MMAVTLSAVGLLVVFVAAVVWASHSSGYRLGRKHEANETAQRIADCRRGRHVWKYVHASSSGSGLLADYRCVHCGDWEQRGK